VVIDTGPIPAEFAPQLSDRLSGVTVKERKIVLDGDAVTYKAEILRLLLDQGVDIRQLSEVHTTLEEVFMEATDR